MATDKRFSVVGISTLKGKTKIRFANDTMRIKILQKNGHEDIDFITLPHEMGKAEAINYLRNEGWYESNTEVQDAMDMVLYRNPRVGQNPVPNPYFVYSHSKVDKTV